MEIERCDIDLELCTSDTSHIYKFTPKFRRYERCFISLKYRTLKNTSEDFLRNPQKIKFHKYNLLPSMEQNVCYSRSFAPDSILQCDRSSFMMSTAI